MSAPEMRSRRSERQRQVAIVPHTHWDREWYSPFQTFRLRLVDLLDEFLPGLEADLSYARFLLDGQMALVDDYLEVRPHQADRLRRLAASGRLSMGPWYTLPDEFLVSGETHIRNLQMGLDRATAFGGAMHVGYLPDMFGHIAQMPQLLRLFGFEHAVVWRGVPSAIDRTAFRWSAPDGSSVRAQYLTNGYGVGASVPDDAKALVRRIAAHEAELGEMLADGILWMNGTDHQVPQPWLGRVVAEANQIQDDYRLEISSLPEFLAGKTTDGLPQWQGELRSGARANLLMGVGSNRVDVKQAASRAEVTLERMAEPLSALYLDPERWPAALLHLAWREVVRNAAHDSICACSADEVVEAVVHRYAEARQIADGLTERALRSIRQSMANAGPVIVNSVARSRGGVVELRLPGQEEIPGTQVLSSRPGGRGRVRRMRAADVAAWVATIHEQRLDENTFVNGIEVEEDDGGILVVLRLSLTKRPEAGAAVEQGRAHVYELLEQRRPGWCRLQLDRDSRQTVLARVDDVAGFGWQRWSPGPLASPVSAEGTTLTNGLVSVTVDADGTFSVDGLAGLGRLVDDGDQGDTYNYCPPASDRVVDSPDEVEVVVAETGPVRATIAVRRRYSWPERVDDDTGERVGSVPTDVLTYVELRAGERFVRVTHELENRSRDHRLRAWFPLKAPATTSRAECAFAIVERGLEAEGGPSEKALPTFPSRRFVAAGDVTIAHEGLLEYELVDEGRALALTLLRATAMLSRGPMDYRPEPAGPLLHLEGPQLQRRLEVRYAVQVGDCDPYALADDLLVPLHVVVAGGGGTRHDAGTELAIEGAEVSAVVRSGGLVEVRVFNPTGDPADVVIAGGRGWVVDLRGSPTVPFEGRLTLRPWEIATLRLEPN